MISLQNCLVVWFLPVFAPFLALVVPAVSAAAPADPVDRFIHRALVEWVVRGETLPASPATLGRMITDLPASVRLARQVTGLDYVLTRVDTSTYSSGGVPVTDFELRTPRGLTARIHTVRIVVGIDTGLFEAVGSGEFRRAGGIFRGLYAMRYIYGEAAGAVRGDFEVYLDLPNPILRFVAFFARGIIADRLETEMARMLSEAKEVMAAADAKIRSGAGF